jgi:hypothetical protein
MLVDAKGNIVVKSDAVRQSLDYYKRRGKDWCCRTGLNCGPPPYQGGALPLSYGSAIWL